MFLFLGANLLSTASFGSNYGASHQCGLNMERLRRSACVSCQEGMEALGRGGAMDHSVARHWHSTHYHLVNRELSISDTSSE